MAHTGPIVQRFCPYYIFKSTLPLVNAGCKPPLALDAPRAGHSRQRMKPCNLLFNSG